MRLVTYNIRGGLGMDGRRSVARIAAVLSDLHPDVVCLQEVHRRLPWSGWQDQPAMLARLTGLSVRFQPNYRVLVGTFGNAVLTRLPILSERSVPLPNPRERRRPLMCLERRGLLEVVVEAAWGRQAVLCTHWSLDGSDRLEAAAVAAGVARALEAPVVLAGDLNALADSPEIARLRAESGLLDAGAVAAAPTFPSDAPRARIDYVWYSSGLAAGAPSVVDTQASDHRPVMVELLHVE